MLSLSPKSFLRFTKNASPGSSEEAYLFADIATTHLPEEKLLSELAPAQLAKAEY